MRQLLIVALLIAAASPSSAQEPEAPVFGPRKEGERLSELEESVEAKQRELIEYLEALQRELEALPDPESFGSIDPSGDLNADAYVGKPLITPRLRARKATLNWLRRRRLALRRRALTELNPELLDPLEELDETIERQRDILEDRAHIKLLGPLGDSFIRYEYHRNRRDLNHRIDDNDTRYPARLNVGFAAVAPGVGRAVVVGLASNTYNANDPRDEMGEAPDIYEAYFDILMMRTPSFEFVPRIGRQALVFGSERVLGNNRFFPFQRSFDALRLSYRDALLDISAFGGWPVVRDDLDDDELNIPSSQESLVGGYAALTPDEDLRIELYALQRRTTRREQGESSPDLDTSRVLTVGLRYEQLTSLGLGFSGELIGQLGRVRGDRHRSLAAAGELSYTLFYDPPAYDPEGPLSPLVAFDARRVPLARVALGVEWAQGDRDPFDGRSQGFQPVYPSPHEFLGSADILGFRNVIDLHASLMLQWRSEVTPQGFTTASLLLRGHIFRLDERDDAAYDIALAPRSAVNSGVASRELGTELDVELRLAGLLTIGYARFFPGEVLKRQGQGDPADFVFVSFGF